MNWSRPGSGSLAAPRDDVRLLASRRPRASAPDRAAATGLGGTGAGDPPPTRTAVGVDAEPGVEGVPPTRGDAARGVVGGASALRRAWNAVAEACGDVAGAAGPSHLWADASPTFALPRTTRVLVVVESPLPPPPLPPPPPLLPPPPPPAANPALLGAADGWAPGPGPTGGRRRLGDATLPGPGAGAEAPPPAPAPPPAATEGLVLEPALAPAPTPVLGVVLALALAPGFPLANKGTCCPALGGSCGPRSDPSDRTLVAEAGERWDTPGEAFAPSKEPSPFPRKGEEDPVDSVDTLLSRRP